MKYILVTLLFISFLNAGFEKIKIGTISNHHKSKITAIELKQIIDEIEQTFENQLGFNVFDYASDGKPIDLLYVTPSTAQKRLDRKIEKYHRKIKKSEDMQSYFDEAKKNLELLQSKYNSQSNNLNNIIKSYNQYIKEVNKIKSYPKEQYNSIKLNIAKQKELINKEKNEKQKLENKLRVENSKYNNKVSSYNNLYRQIKALSYEIESLSRSIKVVKGQAIGEKIVTVKTSYENGVYKQDKKIENTMNKIEIYSFESLEQLKVILAHEIAHLVGIPHIDVKGALMNPILQEEQINHLNLTYEDIRAFDEHF